jgi:hypothetical protein
MRTIIAVACGAALGIAASAAYHAISGSPARAPRPAGAGGLYRASPVPRDSGEPGAARAEPAAPKPAQAPAPVAIQPDKDKGSAAEATELLDAGALAKLSGEGKVGDLRREVGKLLDAKDRGFPVIIEFLKGQAPPPRLAFQRDDRLSIALLAVALEHPEPASKCCRLLLAEIDAGRDRHLREALFRFIPAFLACAGDSRPELRGSFEEALLADLEGQEGGVSRRSLQVMEEMGIEVPAEKLQAILDDPARRNLHAPVLDRLARRGDEASLAVIIGTIDALQRAKDPAIRLALLALARMEGARAQAALEGFLSSPDDDLRSSAGIAFFSRRRGAEALPVARGLLSSGGSTPAREGLVWQVRRTSPEVFEALRKDLGSLPEDVRKAVQIAATSGGEGGGPPAAGGGAIEALEGGTGPR